jgi:uncharacterized damage-inducible protein DinB
MTISEFPWFERQFTLNLSAWMFPNLVERLRGTPARAEELAASLDKDLLTKRDGDEWSIQENVGHLWDLEALWLARVHDFLAGKQVLRSADLTNSKTYEANHNASDISHILQHFRQARQQFVQELEALSEEDVMRTSSHPRLKQPMRLVDHVYFVAEHDDHHLAQITRLKRGFR